MTHETRNLKQRTEKLVGFLVAALTLTVFALYVRTLGKQSLWFDEGLSVFFAAKPLSQLMHLLIYEDLHPPLYYLLLHFWMTLAGNSEYAVRMPSTFAAVLLVPLAFSTIREVWDQREDKRRLRVGVAASALVGASPFIAFYAQETRMYSLAAALALSTTWTYLKATRTTALCYWLSFGLLLAAGFYTQYLSAFIVPAFWLYALLLDHASLPRTFLSTLLAVFLYLPWARAAYLQLERLLRLPDYWVTTRINPSLFLRTMWTALLPIMPAGWVLLAAVFGLLFFYLVVRHGSFKLSEQGRRGALIFLTFLIPLTLTYIMVTLAPKFVTRYAIVSAAPLYICIVLVLYALLHKFLLTRMLFALLLFTTIAISSRSMLAVVDGRINQRDDARGLAAYLTENAQDNDVLLLVENAPYALQYYYRGSAPWYGVRVGQDFAAAAEVLNRILRTQPRRVWLILWHREFADPTDMVVTELTRVGKEIYVEKQFFGYELRAFDIKDYQQPIAAYPQPQTVIHADFVAGLHLLGFDRFTHERGQLHYVFYWQAKQHLMRNYSLTLSFQDQNGNEYLRQNQALCTDYFLPPMWPLDTAIRGRADIMLPADLPPLIYRVYLQVLDPETRHNVDLVDAYGIPLGQALLLEELGLTKADVSMIPAEIKNPLNADASGSLRLLGFDLASTTYSQGDTLRLTLWWQSTKTTRTDQVVNFCLRDSKNAIVRREERPVIAGYFDRYWLAEEVNRAIYRLALPSDLAGGEYLLQVGIAENLIPLTWLHIVPREHRYAVPPMQHSLGVQFEHGITLLGYDLQAPFVQPGKTITVTLYWQAKQPISTSYKVSVQMLSADSRLIAQDDSIPAHWAYPTTAWLPGEIIADEHMLVITPQAAPGSYVLIAVLYNEQNAQRLHVEQASQVRDHVILSTLNLTP